MCENFSLSKLAMINMHLTSDLFQTYLRHGLNERVLTQAIIETVPNDNYYDQYWLIMHRRLNGYELPDTLSIPSNVLEYIQTKALTCVDCKSTLVNILFLPCGHIIVCNTCHTQNQYKICKDCKSIIKEWHVVYY